MALFGSLSKILATTLPAYSAVFLDETRSSQPISNQPDLSWSNASELQCLAKNQKFDITNPPRDLGQDDKDIYSMGTLDTDENLKGLFISLHATTSKVLSVAILLSSFALANRASADAGEQKEPDPNRSSAVELRCVAQHENFSILTPLRAEGSEATNVSAMALLSAVAYENTKVIESVTKELGFYRVSPFEVVEDNWPWFAHTRGFVAESKQEIVIVFEGTDPTWHYTIHSDLDAIQIRMGRLGKVHRGFYRALDIVWNSILQDLAATKSAKPIFITGHSLGAGLATLAAARLLETEFSATTKIEGQNEIIRGVTWNKPYVAALYTFGSPEVGDATFRIQMNDFFSRRIPIFVHNRIPEAPYSARIINENDFVPSLPGLNHYYHIDKPFLLTSDAKLEALNTDADWSIVQPSVSAVERRMFNHEIDISLHYPMTYFERAYRLNRSLSTECLTN